MGEPLSLSISSERAILINADTGCVLFEKGSKELAYPASITKIATSLYILKVMGNHLDQKIKAERDAIAVITSQAKKQSNYRSPPHWLENDGVHMGIKLGEELRAVDLFFGMLLKSANDAANVLAQHVGGGKISKFMEDLNSYLKQIGCRDTHFCNPHGLHHPDHVTTAYDMALIAQHAIRDPRFRKIVSTVHYTIPQTNLEYERSLTQHNLLLRSGPYFYDKATGMKTGYTAAASKTLVATAEDKGRRLIAVILGAQSNAERYQDAKRMFEAAFHEPLMRRQLLPPGLQSLTTSVPGGKGELKTVLPKGLTYDFYPAEKCAVKAHVEWTLPPLPIAENAQVGTIHLLDNRGNSIRETPLFAAQEMRPTLCGAIRLFFSQGPGKKVIFYIGISSCIFYLIARRSRKRSRRSSRPLF